MITVLGLGDAHRQDDGIGIHVINSLKANNHLKNPKFVDLEHLQTILAENHSDADIDQLIVVEAANLDSGSGSVKVFEGIEMDAYINGKMNTCIHKKSLEYALNMTRSDGHLPGHRALICMQPASMEKGDHLTEKAAMAIPLLRRKIFEISTNWVI